MTDAIFRLGYILIVIEVDFFLLEGSDESFGIPVLPRTPATRYGNLKVLHDA
jgi:hypothetical protein